MNAEGDKNSDALAIASVNRPKVAAYVYTAITRIFAFKRMIVKPGIVFIGQKNFKSFFQFGLLAFFEPAQLFFKVSVEPDNHKEFR